MGGFYLQPQERHLIGLIADRAVKLTDIYQVPFVWNEVRVDISTTHSKVLRLRLAELLDANDRDFLRDIAGIARHLDRKAGLLRNQYRPRFVVQVAPTAAFEHAKMGAVA